MLGFTVYIPTRILFGPKQGQAFAKEVQKYGKKALVVTGGGSMQRLGYLDVVLGTLKEAGIDTEVFSGVEPNPLASTIDRAAREFRSKEIEVVIPLGGGSAMDASKAIAALLYEKTEGIWEYVRGGNKHSNFKGALPIAAIPTTAATASEVTPYAVISNNAPKGKSVLAYEFMKPKVAWLNPAFTTKLSPVTTQDGAADILSHIFENYLLGGNDSPLADRHTQGVMRTVIETLPELLKNPEDLHLRGILLWASTLALGGLQDAGRASSEYVLHAIEHSMSAVNHSLAHGRGLATLFPAYFHWLWENNRARERFAKLGRAIFDLSGTDEFVGKGFITRFEEWLSANSLYQNASACGIGPAEYAQVADYAIATYSSDKKALNALGPMTKQDIMNVLQATERQGDYK